MDGNSWRPAQGDLGMASSDWRSEISAESRQRVVNKITETLKRHLPISCPEGAAKLNQIAARFEGKVYTVAISQSDYLRKISLKMLSMETKSTNMHLLALNSAAGSQNLQDSGLNRIQQVWDQGQPFPVPFLNQSQAQQSSSDLAPASSSIVGITHSISSTVVSQSSTLESMSGISLNSVGQGDPQNHLSNLRRQSHARRPQQHQKQPQNQKRSHAQIMGKGKEKVKKRCVSQTDEEEILCSICQDPVTDNGVRSTAKLQCRHQFHLDTQFYMFQNGARRFR